MNQTEYRKQLAAFDDIRPYEPEEMKQAFEDLLSDRQFNVVMKGFAPWLPKGLRNGMLRLAYRGVKTPLGFQKRFMKPIVKHIIRKHTDGCTFDSEEVKVNSEKFATSLPDSSNENTTAVANSTLYTLNSKLNERYTFVSNHRDIVLDSAFLDVMLIEANYPTTVEIGIGDNLLIYPWIRRLVRMNKAFTVRRGLSPKEMLASSQLMSRYIHFAVTQKHENIWLAQREGRAKDSDDRTQEAVLKMLAMGGPIDDAVAVANSTLSTLHSSLKELNIVPLTISYEYDPCDYLKAKEFQLKRDNPSFKKSKQDDLDNMKTGIFGYKGRVHYHCGTPINAWLDELKDLPRGEFFAAVAQRMDREIHRGYRLFPCNYVAADLLQTHAPNESKEPHTTFESHYTPADKTQFETYLQGQLDKISLPQKDESFLRERILIMYANPLKNFLAAQ